MTLTKNPAPAASGNGAQELQQPRHNTKLARIYRALLAGERMTWLDAFERFGCSALNSAVSSLQIRYGVRIEREYIRVDGRWGPATVARYWITPTERRRIRARKAAA